MQSLSAVKGVICDLDGFLVETWKSEPLSGVLDTLAVLKERGIPVAVATNQAGPLWHYATGDLKFPTAEQLAQRLAACASALDLMDAPWCVALFDGKVRAEIVSLHLSRIWDTLGQALFEEGMLAWVSTAPYWRKPQPGMLLTICRRWGLTPAKVIYGGDMDSDQEAAEAASMRFVQTLPEVLALLES